MTMNRTVLTTAALLASVGSAYAGDEHRSKWDGAISVESETAQCSGQFVTSGPVGARFHPQITGSPDHSSFTRFGTGETVRVENDNNGQFNGTGTYELYSISAGQFTGGVSNNKTYTLTQSPANITTATVFVTLSGTLDNYADISGCTITVSGAFVKVDGDIPGY